MNSFALRRAVESALLAPDYRSPAYVNEYLKVHMKRFAETISLLQPILEPGMRIVDLGSYGSLVPGLQEILGATDITLTEPPHNEKPKSEDSFLQNARNGARYTFHIDRFDIEGPFPYPDSCFDIVIFTEVLEHLSRDPFQTMSEINRITKTCGYLMLSTPNCASARSFLRILRGGNPNIYPVYQRSLSTDRHNHEYAPWEIKEVLAASGYRCRVFKTVDAYEDPSFARIWNCLVRALLAAGSALTLNYIKATDRGDTILAVGEKLSPVRERYPSFLYGATSGPASRRDRSDPERDREQRAYE